MTQTQALTILKTGVNVFVTGPAGSGKTHVINEYIKYLKEHEVPVGITASTGIAATHMGGVTIHSWTGIGVKSNLSDHEIAEIAAKSYVKRKIEEAQVLIIDEVSMLHHFRFDLIDDVLRHIKKSDKPFGGIQVVLCGDFFQLPPVSRMGEPQAQFIYTSLAWKKGNFSICYLDEQYRQTDDLATAILNEIRGGEVSDESHELLKSRFQERTMMDIEPTRLYTHNIDVDKVNDEELTKVDGPETIYEMYSKGKKPLLQLLKNTCLAPEILRLRKGARVMCVKNNFDKGYVNGTLGVVVSCGFNVHPVIRTAQNKLVTIEPAKWAIEDDGRVLAEINQYPLRLAWAITVHKSQGMSLDAVEVDLSKSFEPGMGYVALSRVRTLNGLTILGINQHALRVHPEVLEYDRYLREKSFQSETVLQHTDRNEITRAQEEFLARAAPLHSMSKGKKGSAGRKTKEPKVSTYEKTAQFVRKQKPLREIATSRDMTIETIISHLEELKRSAADLDISYLRYEVSPQHWKKIEQALEEVCLKQKDDKPPLLSPVKNLVGPNISFKDIRLVRLLLGYVE